MEILTPASQKFDLAKRAKHREIELMEGGISKEIWNLHTRLNQAANAADMSAFADALINGLWLLARERPDFRDLPILLRAQGEGLKSTLKCKNLNQFKLYFENLVSSIPANLEKMEEGDRLCLDNSLKILLPKAAQIRDYELMSWVLADVIYIYIDAPRSPVRLTVSVTDDAIRIGRHTTISFNRTLRIPEDDNLYPLPAGFGRLPIYRVEDYANKVPAKWLEDGGFFIPLYQREALFVEFAGVSWRPAIAKVAVGSVNAVTGNTFDEQIRSHSQDYVVVPNQSYLDGINKGQGIVGQFVAMPLGQGYTVEELVTDEAKHGGFQLMAYEPKVGRFPDYPPEFTFSREAEYRKRHDNSNPVNLRSPLDLPTLPALPPIAPKPQAPLQPFVEDLKTPLKEWLSAQIKPKIDYRSEDYSPPLGASNRRPDASPAQGSIWPFGSSAKAEKEHHKEANVEMGIAAGGAIQQQIIVDPFGADSWEQMTATPVFIHIVNSEAFEAITGEKPPPTPITAYSYKKRGLPWFSNYDENVTSLPGAKAFQFIKTVLQIDRARGHTASVSHVKITPEHIRRIHVPTINERVAVLQKAAQSSLKSGRYEATIREATWLLDLMPNDPFALLMRANGYVHLNQYDLADMDASAVIQQHPRHIDAYLLRAYANLSSGWSAQAASDARAVLSMSPANEYANSLLSHALQSTPS